MFANGFIPEAVKNDFEESLNQLLLSLPTCFGNIDLLHQMMDKCQDSVLLGALQELKDLYESLDSKEGIIFDLDGTLLNTDLLIKKSFIHTFKKYKPGYTLSEEELLSFLGPSLKNTFSRYVEEDQVDELIQYYREYNHAHHEDYVTIYPYVEEMLKYLKAQDFPLAVVTTKYKKAAILGLDLFNITPYFDVIIGENDVKHSKPDPEGILCALKKLNCQEGYYVGDNVTDIQAGKNAGIKTVGVKWSPKGYALIEKEHPDLLINDYQEFINYIKEKEKC